MRVVFSQRFVEKLHQIGRGWVPHVEALQKRLESIGREEFWSSGMMYRVANLQEDMYVFRIGALRLFALVNVGDQYREDLIAFIDISTKDEVAQPARPDNGG